MGNLNAALVAAVVESLRAAVRAAQTSGEWIVVVCPDGSEFLSAFNNFGAVVFPDGTGFGGRTAVLPGQGRLSVVPVSAEPFVPDGTPFSVMFLGWSDDTIAENARMGLWRTKAARIIR